MATTMLDLQRDESAAWVAANQDLLEELFESGDDSNDMVGDWGTQRETPLGAIFLCANCGTYTPVGAAFPECDCFSGVND